MIPPPTRRVQGWYTKRAMPPREDDRPRAAGEAVRLAGRRVSGMASVVVIGVPSALGPMGYTPTTEAKRVPLSAVWILRTWRANHESPLALMRLAVLLLITTLVGVASCDPYPRDPVGTYDRIVKEGVLRVGYSHAPPWVVHGGDAPQGVEAAFVRRTAETLGVRVRWIAGSPAAHLHALERFELDLAIGGYIATSAPATAAGATASYWTVRHRVGTRTGGVLTEEEIEGLQVAVDEGTGLAAILEEKDAVPVRVSGPDQRPDLPWVGPEWRLAALGLTPSQVVVAEDRHVLLAPPGENRWILWLENRLRADSLAIASELERRADR